jgi:endonuclease III
MEEAAQLSALASHLSSLGQAFPAGWRVETLTRKAGASAGTRDSYFIAPSGRRLRSRGEVARFLGHDEEPPPAKKQRTPASPPPPRTSPFFIAAPPSTTPVSPPRFVGAARRTAECTWVPPPSPYSLIQESLYSTPWRVLVACVLLNKTSRGQVRGIISDLFALCPTPDATLDVPVERIAAVIAPLGLVKRAQTIKQLSREYLSDDWKRVTELHGCGRYASDAYTLFVNGEWRSMEAPLDKELQRYHSFLVETGGEGRGYEREQLLEA